MEKLKVFLPHDLIKKVSKVIKEKPIKFPVPQVIAGKQILQTLAQKDSFHVFYNLTKLFVLPCS